MLAALSVRFACPQSRCPGTVGIERDQLLRLGGVGTGAAVAGPKKAAGVHGVQEDVARARAGVGFGGSLEWRIRRVLCLEGTFLWAVDLLWC